MRRRQPYLLCGRLFFCLAFAGIVSITDGVSLSVAGQFAADWNDAEDRTWVGAEFWANRLQDWQINNHRLECIANESKLPLRTAHLLTTQITQDAGDFELTVDVGQIDPHQLINDDAFVGILLGAGGRQMDYRAASIIHQWPGPGFGTLFGLTVGYQPFIQQMDKENALDLIAQKTSPNNPQRTNLLSKPLILKVVGIKQEDVWKVEFSILDSSETIIKGTQVLSKTSILLQDVSLIGNIALVAHPGVGSGAIKKARTERTPAGTFWFDNLKINGSSITVSPQQVFGPVLTAQYLQQAGTLNLTAQLPPLGKAQQHLVRLKVSAKGRSEVVATQDSVVEPGSWIARFSLDWSAFRDQDMDYELTYVSRGDQPISSTPFRGLIKHDPVEKEVITVGAFSCNDNNSSAISRKTNWPEQMWFPHTQITTHALKHDPDILFFAGDQIYEGAAPTFPDVANIELDYLYKWYLWCWAYRGMTANVPAITLPDDHDVFQGNLWGQGGRQAPGRDHDGGYVHPASFVDIVQKTQSSHLPDPNIAYGQEHREPVEQNLEALYTSLTVGRLGICVLEDRKFKSGCHRPDMPDSKNPRPDHFNDPEFDTTKLDIPGVELLGARQLDYLKKWSEDWKGQDMKLAVSQTIFANMATHHGGGMERLIADLDSNGWPQSGRNKAVDLLRRCFCLHIGGDQHLSSLIKHGIDAHDDANWSFCFPATANFYPRAWAPRQDGSKPYFKPSKEDCTGEFKDGFGNLVTVYAVANPGEDRGIEPKALHNGMPGYGIIKMDVADQRSIIENWPRASDPADPDASQYEGWPRTVFMSENYNRTPYSSLPKLRFEEGDDPVVQVADQSTGEVLYTLRVNDDFFEPRVWGPGTYVVSVWSEDDGEPETTVHSVK